MQETINDILIMLFDFFIGGTIFFLILNSDLRWVTGRVLEVSDFVSYNFYVLFSLIVSCFVCYFIIIKPKQFKTKRFKYSYFLILLD